MRMETVVRQALMESADSLPLPGGVKDRMASGSFCRRRPTAKRLWGGASLASQG